MNALICPATFFVIFVNVIAETFNTLICFSPQSLNEKLESLKVQLKSESEKASSLEVKVTELEVCIFVQFVEKVFKECSQVNI